MDAFTQGKKFHDYKSILEAKKAYERVLNSILTTSSSKFIIGDDELKTKLVYQVLKYKCKAGPERATTSKGLRASSTYKKDCPVVIHLNFKEDKLVVSKAVLDHENHRVDEATFAHYPENMRIDPAKLESVEKMIELGVNKHKLKADLMKDGKSNISLKTLHNVQTKQRLKQQGSNDADIMEKLLERLRQVPNARIKVVTDEKLELIAVVVYDATYQMNNARMPLITQMCVDGNGETEICSVFFARSESFISVGAMVEAFQSFNEGWRKTRVILGDEDFADRGIYAEAFPDAVLHICLYHVLVTFHREITTAYAESERSYNILYSELLSLKLDKVNSYYNENWHNIRDEWTQFGRNAFPNYLNATNNRTESINQKFKMVSNRHANVLSFFDNIFTTVSVLSSERDIRAVKMTMRVTRVRFADDCLKKYNDHLTSFAFKKLELQHELSELIEFAVIRDDSALTKKSNGKGHSVSDQHCTCLYFSLMELKCQHLFKFWAAKKVELFQSFLCAKRWTKAYYYTSHPAINSIQYTAPHQPIHFVKVRVPSEMEKYKKSATVIKDINNLLSSMSNSQFDYFIGKINDVRSEMVGVKFR
ncbi:hypothetical protein HA402_004776 [Bradysia odoriphaga]|nr:hypothetical protein HA402_004776 [Bradysia odoriphaga]